jgi:hypothetical protein
MFLEVVEPVVGLTAERWDLAFWGMQIVVFGVGCLVGLEL